MAFSKDLLTADEEVGLDLRPHWWYITPVSAGLFVAVLIGIVVLINDWHSVFKFAAGILVLVALGFFARRYAQWATTNFVVTNERVISRTGVVRKEGKEIPLDRINTVFFNQGLFERLIGAGDLGIESAGEGGRQTFEDIRKPGLVQQEIYRQKEIFEDNKLQRLSQAVAPQAAPGPTIPEQIEQLDQLRKQGAITETEFQEKKADLLRRM